MGAGGSSLGSKQARAAAKQESHRKKQLARVARRSAEWGRKLGPRAADGAALTIPDATRRGQPLLAVPRNGLPVAELEALFAPVYIQQLRRTCRRLVTALPDGRAVIPLAAFQRHLKLPSDSARLLYDAIVRIEAPPSAAGAPAANTLTYGRLLYALSVFCARPGLCGGGPAFLVPTVPNSIEPVRDVVDLVGHAPVPKAGQSDGVVSDDFLRELEVGWALEPDDSGATQRERRVIEGRELRRWLALLGMLAMVGIEQWPRLGLLEALPDPLTVVSPRAVAGLLEQLFRTVTLPTTLQSPVVDAEQLDAFVFEAPDVTRWIETHVPNLFGPLAAFLAQAFLLSAPRAIPDNVVQQVVAGGSTADGPCSPARGPRRASVASAGTGSSLLAVPGLAAGSASPTLSAKSGVSLSIPPSPQRATASGANTPTALAPILSDDVARIPLSELLGVFSAPHLIGAAPGAVSGDTGEESGDSRERVAQFLKTGPASGILTPHRIWLLQAMLRQPLPDTWRSLYRSSVHGFSQSRFQFHVFKYNGPTLLLIAARPRRVVPASLSAYVAGVDAAKAAAAGVSLADATQSRHVQVASEAEFEVKDGDARAGFLLERGPGDRSSLVLPPLVFGAYVGTLWKESRQFFGSSECALLQLGPFTHVHACRSLLGLRQQAEMREQQRRAAADARTCGVFTEGPTGPTAESTAETPPPNQFNPTRRMSSEYKERFLATPFPPPRRSTGSGLRSDGEQGPPGGRAFCYFNSGAAPPGAGPRTLAALEALESEPGLKGIGFGGKVRAFRLAIDSSLQSGSMQQSWGDDLAATYAVVPFLGQVQIDFDILELEVVGLGGEAAWAEQEAQWNFEEKVARKRQGVNVRGLLDDGVDGMLLEMAGVHQSHTRELGIERAAGSDE